MRIAKEAIPYCSFLLLVTIASYFIHTVFFVIALLCLAFVLFFFRNPHRRINYNDNYILSPADGRIQEITTVDEKNFFEGKAVKVSIFLSLFNVHINRSPLAGKITYAAYRPGKYFPAFKSHASELNERNTIGIENKKVKVLVHQITGFIARRIVCYKKKGDFLNQGEIFGMIKFGSCTEIIIPENVKILVEEGDIVKAGETVLGVIDDDQE
ncbi:MAG: phosphatidylserine decarboxylase family protein [Clostridiales bacterium]|jgi:phosphatidylserine decarboxylase|nr:phosphatidylserine decarboxylase family protein [Clostridiales bacterium]